MAVRASSQVQTFSIGFPGHGSADETEHARLIARHFGTRHTEFMAEDASADLLPRLARQFDEPIIDSSMVPTFLVSQLVRQNCTVALSGMAAMSCLVATTMTAACCGCNRIWGECLNFCVKAWHGRQKCFCPRVLRAETGHKVWARI
jgi:hypothetical protein